MRLIVVGVGTSAASLLVVFSGRFGSIPELHFFYIGGVAEVHGIAAVSLLTAPPKYEKIAPYVWSPRLLETYDEGVRRPWYQQLKIWCGIVVAIWLYLY